MNLPEEISPEHRARIDSILNRENISCERLEYLSKGANSCIYKLFTSSQILIVKVGTNSNFRYLDNEFKTLKIVQSIGPKPIAYDIDKETGLQILLESFIEGSHPFDIRQHSIFSFGRKIAEYHSLHIANSTLPHESWRVFYDNRIHNVAGIESPLTQRFTDAKKAAADIGNRIADDGSKVIVHGDLIPLNLIIDITRKIHILDWEGARLDNPEADLATFIKAFNLSKDQIEELLCGYGLPVNHELLTLRLLLHYLQVVAWRIRCQIPFVCDSEKERVEYEALEEMNKIEELLENILSS